MSNTITTSSPAISFTGDSDTGIWSTGDNLTIVAGGVSNKPIDNYKKVHVARRRARRQLKKQRSNPLWLVTDVSATTLTIRQDP